MTLAPIDAATSAVRSVELLSTTITSSTKSGMACSTFSMTCSSLRQGMITVMDWPLYMGLGAAGQGLGGQRQRPGERGRRQGRVRLFLPAARHYCRDSPAGLSFGGLDPRTD